jgi:hypothetical protein
MSAILPIFIIVIIIIATSAVRAAMQKATFINPRSIRWILLGYIVLLMVSVVVSYTIPQDDEKVIGPGTSIEDAENFVQNFHEAISRGNLSKVEGIFTINDWSFPLHESGLHFKLNQEDQSGMRLLIERKADNDGKVEVFHYTTPYIVQGIDVSEYLVNSPKVELENGVLSITRPERSQIRLARFHREFTITQFTGENIFSDDYYGLIGESVLYVKVPEIVQITADEYIYFEYVTP